MKDPRVDKLASTLIRYSTELQKGEKVLIEDIGGNSELVAALIKEAYAVGGKPFLWSRNTAYTRLLNMGCDEEQLEIMAENDSALMKQMDAYVGVRGGANAAELSDVPMVKKTLYDTVYSSPVHSKIRVPDTKWVVLRYPTDSMAQLANMSTEAFEDFYFDVCNLDYAKMGEAMKPLINLMNKTDKVRIVGPLDTDISFSIKGIATIPCNGQCNIPDGEIYTAPIKDSVNGVIHYNTPSLSSGFKYEDIRFEFKDGKIIKATANDSQKINTVLDTDDGARYIGEFAIGVNPYILDPMCDTLFDEKIAGSIHFTPGNAYDEADNGNKSAVHWDLVLIQREEYGGGEIYFDDVLVRKDGIFVVSELEGLNPDKLK